MLLEIGAAMQMIFGMKLDIKCEKNEKETIIYLDYIKVLVVVDNIKTRIVIWTL